MLKKLLFIWRILAGAFRRLDKDDGLFLASGLAFNMLLCLLPFLLIAASLSGYLLESSQENLLRLLENAFPEATHRLQDSVLRLLNDREIIGVLGLLALALAASRLFGGIRVVLKLTYGHELDLNMITGKLFDIGMVLLSCVLLLLSLGFSTIINVIEEGGRAWFAEKGYDLSALGQLAGHVIAYVFTTAMFFVMYRMPLPKHVPTSIVLITALLVGALWEIAKWLFEFYLSKVSAYDVLYGSFGVLVVSVLWINYSAIIFVFGAELGASMLALRKGVR